MPFSEIRIPTVYEDVASFHAACKFLHGLLCRIAGRHHQPGDAGLGELAYEIVERGRSYRAFFGQVADVLCAQVATDNFVTAAHQTASHVRAHFPKSDHTQPHSYSFAHREC